MSASITVTAKQIGNPSNRIADLTLTYPPDFHEANTSRTLGELICHIVAEEVEAFQQRQNQRRFYPFMTAQEIGRDVMRGKVNVASSEAPQNVDLQQSIKNVQQAFVDGLYYIFIDDVHYTEWDAPISLMPGSMVSVIRLVALAGG